MVEPPKPVSVEPKPEPKPAPPPPPQPPTQEVKTVEVPSAPIAVEAKVEAPAAPPAAKAEEGKDKKDEDVGKDKVTTPPPRPEVARRPPPPARIAEASEDDDEDEPAPVEEKKVIKIRVLEPKNKIKPPYPKQALRMGVEGKVRVRLLVDGKGKVSTVTILESTPKGIFDKTASDTVKKYVFEADGTEFGVEQEFIFRVQDY